MNSLNKTILVYALISIFAFIFNKVYNLFGHGVTSPWMSNMYLFLIAFGVLIFLMIRIFLPNLTKVNGYRLFFNLYNSGVASFVNGMLLKGIFEIAGGTSNFTLWFLYIGAALMVLSIGTLCFVMLKEKKYFKLIICVILSTTILSSCTVGLAKDNSDNTSMTKTSKSTEYADEIELKKE